MNTIDKSTEDLDDAMFGRVRSIQFPPRIEDLRSLLDEAKITDPLRAGVVEFFAEVQRYYPLGHGYYAELGTDSDPLAHYLTAIRPVLANHFEAYEPETLAKIDNLFDETVMRIQGG